jgi:hypothetical protein
MRRPPREQVRDDEERKQCYRGVKCKEIIERRLLDDGLQGCIISSEKEKEKRTTTTENHIVNREKKKKKNKERCWDQ